MSGREREATAEREAVHSDIMMSTSMTLGCCSDGAKLVEQVQFASTVPSHSVRVS